MVGSCLACKYWNRVEMAYSTVYSVVNTASIVYSTIVCSCLACKYWTRVEMAYSVILQYFCINYIGKKFYSIGSYLPKVNLTFSVVAEMTVTSFTSYAKISRAGIANTFLRQS